MIIVKQIRFNNNNNNFNINIINNIDVNNKFSSNRNQQ